MDIPKAMQDKLAGIREAATLEGLTMYLTTAGLQKPAAAMKAVQAARSGKTKYRTLDLTDENFGL